MLPGGPMKGTPMPAPKMSPIAAATTPNIGPRGTKKRASALGGRRGLPRGPKMAGGKFK